MLLRGRGDFISFTSLFQHHYRTVSRLEFALTVNSPLTQATFPAIVTGHSG